MPFPLEGRHYAQLTLRGWEVTLYLLEGWVSTWIIQIFLYKKFVHSSPFINLFNHLFMLEWMHVYLIYMLGYNPILLYLLLSLRLSQLWPLGAPSVGFCVSLTWPHLYGSFFFFFFSMILLVFITEYRSLINNKCSHIVTTLWALSRFYSQYYNVENG